MLDIGCGGGILSEPLARLGAQMVGADPAEEQYRGGAARMRRRAASRSITAPPPPRRWRMPASASTWCWPWRWSSTSPTSALFVATLREMVKPGGLMIAATLNRTLKSFALAIVGAEYVLRWLPRGTHQWDKFVTPERARIAIERGGLRVTANAA